MEKEDVIKKTIEKMKDMFEKDSSGHDYWHIHRVHKVAMRIAKEEGNADLFIVELAALLHDIADWKFHGGDFKAGSKAAREWLESLDVEEDVIVKVCDIIDNVSFKGGKVKNNLDTIEGKCVQDADRMDAIGAIGISRTFATGSGLFKRPIYNPDLPLDEPETDMNKESRSSLHHFYDKILLLKDRMKTDSGKRLAQERHDYTEEYVKRFLAEWDGKK